MDLETQLVSLCVNHGANIAGLDHNGQKVHGGRLLLTIAGLESTFGKWRLHARMEPAYGPGGTYYKASRTVRDRWQTYGCLAASSYGTFQVMFLTAEELGFVGHPIDLQKDEVCIRWATALITDRIIKHQGAKTLRDVLDAYNSGSSRDAVIPAAYIARGIDLYTHLDNV